MMEPMRRAGGWILGAVVVAAMAGGAWIALRPLYTRQQLYIGYFRSSAGRDPSNDAMFSGAQFALDEAGRKAGRFKLEFVESKPIYSKMPPVWIGTSEAMLELGDHRPYGLRICLMDTLPKKVDPQVRILAGYAEQGRAAARWAQSTGAKVLLLCDQASPRGAVVSEAFSAALETPDEHVIPDKRADLVARMLAHAPGVVFYSGEDAPYATAESVFKELRAKGYTGKLLMAEADPEVSFLAVPCRVPEGTLLISPIGPPSKEFAAKYEPATGRHAGPHGWVGYQAMKATLDLLDQMDSLQAEEFERVLAQRKPLQTPCFLYEVRSAKFEFVQELK